MSAEAANAQASVAAYIAVGWRDPLMSRGSITAADAAQLYTVHREPNQSLASVAQRLGKISERSLAEAMTEFIGRVFVVAADSPEQPVAPANVVPASWRNHELLPL